MADLKKSEVLVRRKKRICHDKVVRHVRICYNVIKRGEHTSSPFIMENVVSVEEKQKRNDAVTQTKNIAYSMKFGRQRKKLKTSK